MENAKNLEQLSHQLYNLVVSDKLSVVEYSPDKVHCFRFFLVPTNRKSFKALVCNDRYCNDRYWNDRGALTLWNSTYDQKFQLIAIVNDSKAQAYYTAPYNSAFSQSGSLDIHKLLSYFKMISFKNLYKQLKESYHAEFDRVMRPFLKANDKNSLVVETNRVLSKNINLETGSIDVNGLNLYLEHQLGKDKLPFQAFFQDTIYLWIDSGFSNTSLDHLIINKFEKNDQWLSPLVDLDPSIYDFLDDYKEIMNKRLKSNLNQAKIALSQFNYSSFSKVLMNYLTQSPKNSSTDIFLRILVAFHFMQKYPENAMYRVEYKLPNGAKRVGRIKRYQALDVNFDNLKASTFDAFNMNFSSQTKRNRQEIESAFNGNLPFYSIEKISYRNQILFLK